MGRWKNHPAHCPEPLGKTVDTTTHVDANLWHDLLTEQLLVLHSLHDHSDWYPRSRTLVRPAPWLRILCSQDRHRTDYGSEDNPALYGVPVGQSYMLGDNESVVQQRHDPHSRLNKRHTALSYHRVREAISAGIMRFFHISGVDNPSDIPPSTGSRASMARPQAHVILYGRVPQRIPSFPRWGACSI
jgi:hypothetical protein